MKKSLLFLLFTIVAFSVSAQLQVDAPEPSAIVVDAKGEESPIVLGELYSGEAPVRIKLSANADDVEGYSLVCSWEFLKEGEAEPYLVRYDADVELELRESGVIVIQPKIVYTSRTNSEIYWEFGSEVYEPFRVQLAESKLELPNAFSPNGDGINDFYNVLDNVKSIVEFSGAIYNRWGQQLFSWGIDEIGCEECGWDGTYKGKPVKAGVYFVVVKARGADGVNYEIRRDVNLLRGYTEEAAGNN